jgi:ParB family chromosome partitioning protein
VRPEDEPAPEPAEVEEGETGAPDGEDDDDADRYSGGQGQDDEDDHAQTETTDEPVGDATAPLSARLIADLTAHRTAALRDALAGDPDLALVALVHALVLRVFGGGGFASCLDIRMGSHVLSNDGDGIEDSLAGLANAERHGAWARQMPQGAEAMWDFVVGLDGDSRASLLAHCVSLSLNAVRGFERRPLALAHAETLATALDLDMTAYWKPTAGRYLDRVTKAHVLAAVAEGLSGEAAGRLAGLRKPEMVAAAEPMLVQTPWLPALLRTVKLGLASDSTGDGDDEAAEQPVSDPARDDSPPREPDADAQPSAADGQADDAALQVEALRLEPEEVAAE